VNNGSRGDGHGDVMLVLLFTSGKEIGMVSKYLFREGKGANT